MDVRPTVVVCAVCLLAGCNAVDGTYYPGCVAFAGDKVVLADGRFSWDKFTDEVRVDDQGEVIDQFPGHPKRGSYRLRGTELQLTFDADGAVETMHVMQHEGRTILLNTAQLDASQATGRHDDCALTREAEAGS